MSEALNSEINTKSSPAKRPVAGRRSGTSKHDEIVNDILKHLTTLNTGLLAILSVFNEQIRDLLQSNNMIGALFVYAFYFSLVLCMAGFILTIISLQVKKTTWRNKLKFLRDLIILFAALGYICALMFLVTLYTSAFGLS